MILSHTNLSFSSTSTSRLGILKFQTSPSSSIFSLLPVFFICEPHSPWSTLCHAAVPARPPCLHQALYLALTPLFCSQYLQLPTLINRRTRISTSATFVQLPKQLQPLLVARTRPAAARVTTTSALPTTHIWRSSGPKPSARHIQYRLSHFALLPRSNTHISWSPQQPHTQSPMPSAVQPSCTASCRHQPAPGHELHFVDY